MSELLIVIPAYNEEENIERVVNHLITDFPQYDYVVVNVDVDQTVETVREIISAERMKRVRQTGLVKFVEELKKEAEND